MSLKAFIWAGDQTDLLPGEKLVLYALAYHHNHKTGRCFPSVATLANHTSLSRRGVFNVIKSLTQKRLIGKTSGRKGVTNKYYLTMQENHHVVQPVHHGVVHPLHQVVQETDSGGALIAPKPGKINQEGTKKEVERASKPASKSKKRASQIPLDWKPDQELLDWAHENFVSVKPADETPKFIDYHIARAKPMIDWRATWRNWIRNADGYARERNPNASKPKTRRPTTDDFTDELPWETPKATR